MHKFYLKHYTQELHRTIHLPKTGRPVLSNVYGSWTWWNTYDPYSSYGWSNAFTDRINRTVHENDSQIVNKVFLSCQFVTKCCLENFVDPYGPYTNRKCHHGSYQPYGSWKGFTGREYIELLRLCNCDMSCLLISILTHF